ncbi:hypothetical protein C8R47DRAFT_1226181 [Mycena vitilis]|nr:hypothetical protein C8R47DRAFT_1229665 [Mycena vitilis]KAJ6455110.1 hypothetical protein C8R47DRAFT_1228427 [Mycena vitilis]KAJ6460678.1 hypothetical protein C8R47DRAFT_1226181 [Mycena vitilis]
MEGDTKTSPAAYHPGHRFLQAESAVEGDQLLASLSYPQDFKLVRVDDGGGVLYTSRSTGRGLHVLLLGHLLSAVAIDATRTLMSLGTFPSTSKKGQTYFDNTMFELDNIVSCGTDKYSTLIRSWAPKDDPSGPHALIDMFQETKIINGPLAIGAAVLVDATLHRRDTRNGGKWDKASNPFNTIKTAVESVHYSHLSHAGIIESDISDDIVIRASAMTI